jgi:glycosyltransferase involved in cell wall biosynthesis
MHAGESSNAHHLCRHLAGRNHEVHVLTSEANTGAGDPGIRVHPIMQTWSWLEAPRFTRFARQCAPDAVLLVYLNAIYNYHPMMTFSPTLVRRLMPRVPFVTRYESPVGGAAPRTTLSARVGRKVVAAALGGKDILYSDGTLLRDSDRVIVLCEGHREVLAQRWPQIRDKVVVIPPPPNIVVSPEAAGSARTRGRALLGLAAEEFVIAFFGYVYPKKGIETLLEAFGVLSHDHPRARLVFIGGTLDIDSDVSGRYWDEMQQLCRALGIADKTLWTGAFRSDREEGSLYLRAADVCVLPLLNGVQLNNSSFSALAAHGMPIVTTRGPATDRVFADGDNVLFFEARNAGALAEKLKFLMNNSQARERLRSGVGMLAREWLSWDRGIERTLATLGVGAVPVHA